MPGQGLGWVPEIAVRAEARMLASGRYFTVAAPTAPLPQAISLTRYKIKSYNQGANGTCWTFSPKQLAETMAVALGYDAYPVSSMLTGYYAKQQYEGGGNQGDGGSPTDAIRAMTSAGVGIAHEALWPYSDDPRKLGMKPPQAVWDDASDTHLLGPVIVKTPDQAKQLIASKRGVCNGIPWPENWEGPGPLISKIGRIVGGHSVLWLGFVGPGVFDDHAWLQFDNWRQPQYKPLPPALAAKVPGYKPTTATGTTDFWIREDVYLANCRGQVTEHVSATDLDGLTKGQIDPDGNDQGIVDAGPSFAGAIPI